MVSYKGFCFILINVILFITSGCMNQPSQSQKATIRVQHTPSILERATMTARAKVEGSPQGTVTITPTLQIGITGEVPTQSSDVYPAPGMESDITLPAEPQTPFTPYPGPGYEPLLQTPVPGYPYPGQGEDSDQNTPIPLSPTSTTMATVSPTSLSPGNYITPTQTSTSSVIRTGLEATDPASFKLASGKVQFVEFFAFWSPISKSMAPLIYQLENKYNDRIEFVYLDIDNPANDLYNHMMGERIPPVFFLLAGDGTVLKEWSGYIDNEEIEKVLIEILQ